MIKNPLVLTFDLGTQSLRAMLVDKTGKIVAINQVKYPTPYFSKEAGYAEQAPNYYFERLVEAVNGLKKNNENLLKDVIACTLTTIRDTVLCLDKNNLPLRDIIVWLDKREADRKELKPIPALKKMLLALVGVTDVIDMQQRQSVCNWLMINEKEIWEKTAKYVMLPTYLNYLLTGELKDSVANQIGHIPIDYKNGCWQPKNALTRFIFDVPTEKLCELVNPGDSLGKVKDELCDAFGIARGTELIATGSDKGCETLGLSVFSKNKAAVSFGTSATIQFTTDKYYEPTPFAPAYPAVVKGYYNGEIQIYRGYWMLTWFKEKFCHEEIELAKKEGTIPEVILNRTLKDVPIGCDGLILQPYWGAGIQNPNARGSMIGFTDIHDKYHMYRAIIEGINFDLYRGMLLMEKSAKQKIEEIYVGGGGSQSDEIVQMAADMFGLPVKRIQTHEACGIGSSLVAFVSKGIYSSVEEAVKYMIQDKDVFIPNKENHEKYLKYYHVYEKLYKRLDPLFVEIKEILKNE